MGGDSYVSTKNPYIANAAQTVYRVTEDERIRQMCEAREEGEKTQRTIELLHQMELQQAKEELQKRMPSWRQPLPESPSWKETMLINP